MVEGLTLGYASADQQTVAGGGKVMKINLLCMLNMQ